MNVLHSRITSKSQTTIPKKVREALKVGPGDTLVYELEKGRVIVRKATGLDRAYLGAVQATLSEWDSPQDDEAYNNL